MSDSPTTIGDLVVSLPRGKVLLSTGLCWIGSPPSPMLIRYLTRTLQDSQIAKPISEMKHHVPRGHIIRFLNQHCLEMEQELNKPYQEAIINEYSYLPAYDATQGLNEETQQLFYYYNKNQPVSPCGAFGVSVQQQNCLRSWLQCQGSVPLASSPGMLLNSWGCGPAVVFGHGGMALPNRACADTHQACGRSIQPAAQPLIELSPGLVRISASPRVSGSFVVLIQTNFARIT